MTQIILIIKHQWVHCCKFVHHNVLIFVFKYVCKSVHTYNILRLFPPSHCGRSRKHANISCSLQCNVAICALGMTVSVMCQYCGSVFGCGSNSHSQYSFNYANKLQSLNFCFIPSFKFWLVLVYVVILTRNEPYQGRRVATSVCIMQNNVTSFYIVICSDRNSVNIYERIDIRYIR
jgi:hypothetical protein